MRKNTSLIPSPSSWIRLAMVASFVGYGATSVADPVPIKTSTMQDVDRCLEATYHEFIINSRSACIGVSKYYDSGGNTNSRSASNRYRIPWPGYQFQSGTASTVHEGGQCIHEISAAIENPTQFLCYYYTKGCGWLKPGGHVRGYCNVGIEYIPLDGDVIDIKRYCLSVYAGGVPLPKPKTYKIGCTLP